MGKSENKKLNYYARIFYRIVCFLFCLTNIYIGIEVEGYYLLWFIYLTHWVHLLVTFTFFIYLFNSFLIYVYEYCKFRAQYHLVSESEAEAEEEYEKINNSGFFYELSNILFVNSFVLSGFVAFIYWSFIFDGKYTLTGISLHGITFILLCIDYFFNIIKINATCLTVLLIFSFSYLEFLIYYHYKTSTWIYKMLDPALYPNYNHLLMLYMLLLNLLIFFYLLFYLINLTKNFVYSCIYSCRNYNSNNHLNDNKVEEYQVKYKSKDNDLELEEKNGLLTV